MELIKQTLLHDTRSRHLEPENVSPTSSGSTRKSDSTTNTSISDGECDKDNKDGVPVDRQECDDGDEDDEFKNFLPVMKAINLDSLSLTALRVRTTSHLRALNGPSMDFLTCSISDRPMVGATNAVWVITFSDGIKWIARVPGCALGEDGDPFFDAFSTQEFLTRVHLTQFLRTKTTIPIPQIFAWEEAVDNPLRVPYTLEAFCEGSLLADLWDNPAWTTEDKRVKVLSQLAFSMAQLAALRFDKIGGPNIDHDRETPYIGQILEREGSDDDEERTWGAHCYAGPYTSTKAFFHAHHDDPEPRTDHAKYLWGHQKLASLAIDSIPGFIDQKGFFLAHIDFNSQNILIDEDANVTAIIDWDNCHTRPPAFGCARYPIWITVDWDPVNYAWGELHCCAVRNLDTPAQLLRYRQIYASIFAQHCPAEAGLSPLDSQVAPLLEAIWYAKDHQTIPSPWILDKILDWAFDSKAPCTLNDFSDAYVEGKADEWTESIREAFSKMWHQEMEDPVAYEEDTKRFLMAVQGFNRKFEGYEEPAQPCVEPSVNERQVDEISHGSSQQSIDSSVYKTCDNESSDEVLRLSEGPNDHKINKGYSSDSSVKKSHSKLLRKRRRVSSQSNVFVGQHVEIDDEKPSCVVS